MKLESGIVHIYHMTRINIQTNTSGSRNRMKHSSLPAKYHKKYWAPHVKQTHDDSGLLATNCRKAELSYGFFPFVFYIH